MLAGAEKLLAELAGSVDPAAMRVVRAPCVGRCAGAPAARIGDREVDHATSDGLLALARAGETKVVVPSYTALEAYSGGGRLSSFCARCATARSQPSAHRHDAGRGAARPGRRRLSGAARNGRSSAPIPAPA